MKKILNLLAPLFIFAALVFAPKSMAASISDIDSNYWANNEIIEMVDEGVMNLDSDNKFNPEAPVERGAFSSMLIKVLNQSGLEVFIENPFPDVNSESKYYDDIMKSQQIGLVYGYPDGTFRPAKEIDRAEVTSVMSHITKDTIDDLSFLESFTDIDLIPDWAKASYAKTVKYGLFVNYPDKTKFEPDREITRAETAVLLSRLKKTLTSVKDEYVSEEQVLSTEHLSIHSKADSNVVTVTNLRKIIARGNILNVSFIEKYNSKGANTGDEIILTNEKDITTTEGTVVIPAGAKFHASVQEVVEPKIFNKQGAIKLNFTGVELPNGVVAQMDGTVFNKQEGYLKGNSAKKLTAYTIGGLAVGAGAGTAVGIPTDEEGLAYGIGLPVGGVGGYVIGLLTKGSPFKANKGHEVYVKLNQDLSIQDNL